MAAEYLGQHGGGDQVLDFDGHAEVLLDNWDILDRLRADPYYKDVVEPSEAKLIDKGSVKRRVGYEEVWVS
ncbi:hypothetical protein EYZ11_012838 [Aspergillus tanneri]|uniref:EthD domain-containing protein n=1 Tax=Aspergillus tanneri TaxID=1220188 RepID=A0A4S3IZ69_9EURO|nr:uncharacterized protein ATNIH1004_009234 [Aspergillus tanneri]KAA8645023.1 hypothetical protein ATNIH1004_009234 [Aspergillus tanneri]THC87716.1 hypothetical protein EYZ11_012838 [Aspergillus tanneri]